MQTTLRNAIIEQKINRGRSSTVRMGFDIGGTKIAAGIIDGEGLIRARRTAAFPKKNQETAAVDLLSSLAEEMLEELHIKLTDLAAIGAAVPGRLNRDRSRILYAYNLNFFDLPLHSILSARFPGVPVRLLNDAEAATLAEWKAGSLKGCRTAILLTLGTGVGGGLILNGSPFFGGLGHGVEPGHMILEKGGILCTCGTPGCAETLVSASRLARQGYGNAKNLIDAARKQDKKAAGLFEDYLEDLSSFLASLANLLDPERIAIGGGLSGAGEFLFDPLQKQIAEKSFFHYEYPVVPAALGNDAGMIGAALAQDIK